jgi:hypothetical protein
LRCLTSFSETAFLVLWAWWLVVYGFHDLDVFMIIDTQYIIMLLSIALFLGRFV